MDTLQINNDGGDEVDVNAESCCVRWRDTFIVTGVFVSVYTAYLALQALQSSLNQEAGLGVASLACLYGSVIILGIFTPTFLRIVGAKWTIVIACSCHCLYVVSNFYPTWGTLIPTSVLLGGIAGPQWTSQGLYITASGERMSRRSGESLHSVLSKLNGNLISSLVLSQSSYSNSSQDLSQCGPAVCPTPEGGNVTLIAAPQYATVYLLLSVFLAFDIVGLVMAVCLLPCLKTLGKGDKNIKHSSSNKALLSWFLALSDPKLLVLVPYFISCTVSQTILFTDFTQAYISCSVGVSMVGFIMAAHGGTTVLVAVATAKLAKYTGRYVLIGSACICNAAMLLTLMILTPTPDSVLVYVLLSATWGIAVGIFHTQNNSLVGLLFPEKKEAAFANYHTWNSIGYTVALGYGSALCVYDKLSIAIGLSVIGATGYAIAEIIYARQVRFENKLVLSQHSTAETEIISSILMKNTENP